MTASLYLSIILLKLKAIAAGMTFIASQKSPLQKLLHCAGIIYKVFYAKSPQIHFADFPTLTQTLQNYTIIELNQKPDQV
jgi:hypothetical protein